MEFLLPKSVKKQIENKYADNPVFFVLKGPVVRISKGHSFYLSPEEVFYYLFYSWDIIKEKPNEAHTHCEYLADYLLQGIKEANPKAKTEEVEYAISVVLQTMCECFSLTDDAFYIELCPILRTQINKFNATYASEIHCKFAYALRRYNQDSLTAFLQEYKESDKLWISDEIDTIITGTKDSYDSVAEDDNKFSINQLIIIAEFLLEIPLSASDTNISAVARFLAMLSPYSEKSIRPKLEKFDDNSNKTKQDANKIAAMISKINPQKAIDLKEYYDI